MGFFPSPSRRRYWRLTNKILAVAEKYRELPDEELQHKTIEFRERLANGESLRSLLVEAYATVVVADERVVHMTPFPVQILGAVAMEYNNIIEMKTGEGKTLTATMIMYLHGLTGPGNFLITANSYLANRDADDMGRVYKWLGLTVMSGVARAGRDPEDRSKKAIYGADIVYTTNSTLGFDYLFDNLASTTSAQAIKGFRFGLIDEVDAVLLDSASTPLVISGGGHAQSNLFFSSDRFVRLLKEKVDFERSEDEKKVWLTIEGIEHAQRYFGLDDILSEENSDYYRHIILALRAHYLYRRDRGYVVNHGKVLLVDNSNGRELDGMKLEAGMHQAIEAKEGVKLTSQSTSMAQITYQNLFRMFSQLSGMTGTAATDHAEFMEVYNLAVFKVDTNRPNIRIDRPDKLYITNEAKLRATLDLVKENYKLGRPILIETGSLAWSNLYSRLLLSERIPHSLLNAKSAAKEAHIVSEAGEIGTVTVATSMAGRGTDIHLQDGVTDLGGLLVLGTERMGSKRVDNQLRGRSGRQGDPGESVFYTSLEDRVVVRNTPRRIRKWTIEHQDDDEQSLKKKRRFKNVINRAQHAEQAEQRSARFGTLEYGEVFRVQRDNVYKTRNQIMQLTDMEPLVTEVLDKAAVEIVESLMPKKGEAPNEKKQLADAVEFIYQNLDRDFNPADLAKNPKRALDPTFYREIMTKRLASQHEILTDDGQWTYYERLAFLRAIDSAWMGQVDNLMQLQTVSRNRVTTGKDPLYEYQKAARESYGLMQRKLHLKISKNLFTSTMKFKKDGTVNIQFQ